MQQKPHGQIFKPKVEDWDATIAQAILSNRVLLLKNVDAELHSEDLAVRIISFLSDITAAVLQFSFGFTIGICRSMSKSEER
jgi:hypothetical protein